MAGFSCTSFWGWNCKKPKELWMPKKENTESQNRWTALYFLCGCRLSGRINDADFTSILVSKIICKFSFHVSLVSNKNNHLTPHFGQFDMQSSTCILIYPESEYKWFPYANSTGALAKCKKMKKSSVKLWMTTNSCWITIDLSLFLSICSINS